MHILTFVYGVLAILASYFIIGLFRLAFAACVEVVMKDEVNAEIKGNLKSERHGIYSWGRDVCLNFRWHRFVRGNPFLEIGLLFIIGCIITGTGLYFAAADINVLRQGKLEDVASVFRIIGLLALPWITGGLAMFYLSEFFDGLAGYLLHTHDTNRLASALVAGLMGPLLFGLYLVISFIRLFVGDDTPEYGF
jgi:hypothetical protein